MSKFKPGDKVKASASYMETIKDNPGIGPFDSFVVHSVKSGPVYSKNANGYHIGGWINEDVIYEKRGAELIPYRASEITHSEATESGDKSSTEGQEREKKGWFW